VWSILLRRTFNSTLVTYIYERIQYNQEFGEMLSLSYILSYLNELLAITTTLKLYGMKIKMKCD